MPAPTVVFEQLENLYTTTLAAPYVAGSGSITVASAGGYAGTNPFSLTILDPVSFAVLLIFRVTSVAGTTFSGAAEGPDANAPSNAIVVGSMLTAASVAQIELNALFNGPGSDDETQIAAVRAVTGPMNMLLVTQEPDPVVGANTWVIFGNPLDAALTFAASGFGGSFTAPIDSSNTDFIMEFLLMYYFGGSGGWTFAQNGLAGILADVTTGESYWLVENNGGWVVATIAFAQLPVFPQNGMQFYVSDGQVTSPLDNTLIGGGTGAMAFYINGVWKALQ